MKDLLHTVSAPLLAFLIQSAIVAGLALTAGRFAVAKGPAYRIAIYRAAVLSILALLVFGPLIRTVAAPMVEIGAAGPVASAIVPTVTDSIRPAPVYRRPIEADQADTEPSGLQSILDKPSPASRGSAVSSAAPRAPLAIFVHPSPERKAAIVSTQPSVGMADLLCIAYFVGVLAIVAGILLGAVWLFGIRLTSTPYLKRRGAVASTKVKGAFVAGAIKPTIYLPADIESRYEPSLVEAILLHEQVHIGQRDCLWNLLSRIACAVTWVNPLAWILAGKLRQDSELMCDRLVLDTGFEPAAYAGCLLKLAEGPKTSPTQRLVGVGVFTSKSHLSKRISLMLNPQKHSFTPVAKSARLRVAGAFALILAGSAMVVSAAPIFALRHDATPEDTVKAFFDSLNKRDFRAAVSHIEDANVATTSTFLLNSWRPAALGLLVETPRITHVSVSGNTATVEFREEGQILRVDPKTRDVKSRNLPSKDDVATLHRVGNEWVIAAGKNLRGEVSMVVGFAHDQRYVERAKNAKKQTILLSKFRNLALNLIVDLTIQNDSRRAAFPLTQAAVKDREITDMVRGKLAEADSIKDPAKRKKAIVAAYAEEDSLWKDADGRPMDIRLNPALLGKDTMTVMNSSGCVMLSLGPKEQPQSLYGMVPVAFCDGHVKMVTPEQAANLSWNCDATPEETVAAFLDATARRDWRGVFSRIYGAKVDEDLAALPKNQPVTNPPPAPKLRFFKEQISGDDATIMVAVDDKKPSGGAVKNNEPVQVKLHRENGDWKISGGGSGQGAYFDSVVKMARNPDQLRKAYSMSTKVPVIQSDFKQIGLAILMYANDHDDKYPPDPSKLKSTLAVYLRGQTLWIGLDRSPLPVRMNPWLVGKIETQIEKPAECVLLSLGSKGHLIFIDGKTPITFCDGHTKMLTPEDAAKLKWRS